ncbi:AGAP000056-PA-like protein [Anopheles sinensis]|uniref:AGAP000056-PA-like protein n=1 Tax=Anopheles sinensis TaxID=74873 RepID=A0A084WPT2_ANOSI|nr:AGAP000056-PA-like protein [Anopheles sinensis]
MSNALSMTNSGFPHSWIVSGQDFCPITYSSIQSHNSAVSSNLATVEPGLIELRKEKSRDAARSRRGKENYEFYELAKMLPLPAAITSQLDKASIIRLTISYLKLKEFSENGVPSWCKEPMGFQNYNSPQYFNEMFETHLGTHILQSLDGFAISTGVDGRFLYISETVSIYLGLSQVEMTGSSIFDYVHKHDHAEVEQQLGVKKSAEYSAYGGYGDEPPEKTTVLKLGKEQSGATHGVGGKGLLPGETYEGDDRAFCIRMKSTLTKRGCHFKSSGYRVILLLCHLRKKNNNAAEESQHGPTTDKQTVIGMVGIGIALPPPSLHEIKLESDMFVFRTSLDLTIIHCENRISSFLDYTADELNGKSIYTLCHGQDAHKLKKSHSELIQKGQVLTPFYRILNKNAGYFWIQSCCTMVCQTKNMSDQTVICVNYIITKPEKENLILDISQIPSVGGGDYPQHSAKAAQGGVKKSGPVVADFDLDGKSLGGGELGGGGVGGHQHHHHHQQHQPDSYLEGQHGHAHGVDHKDLLEKTALAKQYAQDGGHKQAGGLGGMVFGAPDKKDLEFKDKLLEREKGCSNSKHQRLKSGSPMLNHPNENGGTAVEKKSSGSKKSINNRASVIRVLNKSSKKVLQESH